MLLPPDPRPPIERFALIMELLCAAVAASNRPRKPFGRLFAAVAGPLIILIWTRLRRITRRFTRLVARIQAGRPRRRTTPRPAPPAPPPARPPRPRKPAPAQNLPQGFAWLLRLVPETTHGRSQLYHLLADPEMQALIAASPEAGRILRPLCRMLGIRLPPVLLPPRLTPEPEPDPSGPAAGPDPPATIPAPMPADFAPRATPPVCLAQPPLWAVLARYAHDPPVPQ